MSDEIPAPSDLEAMELEERPTGDFVDGFLAGAATLCAAITGRPKNSLFYSFDWIGESVGDREITLHSAFRSDAETMSFEIEQLRDWRGHASRLGAAWLGRGLDDGAAAQIGEEFLDLLEAFLGDAPAEVFAVRPRPPASGAPMRPEIGAEFDHLLIEIGDGRLLLEFSSDG